MKLFGWFRKKEEKKIQHKIEFETQKFNVGKTYLYLLFKDGNEFIRNIYGSVNQPYSDTDKNYMARVFAFDPSILKSSELAVYFIRGISDASLSYVDDDLNPTTAYVGKLKKVDIGKTEDFFIDFNVAKLVEE